MTPAWWNGRTVLVTGHTGFKGAWLCLMLRRFGATVVGFSLPEPVSNPNLFELARLQKDVQSVAGDVRDVSSLTAAVGSAKPSVVVHMAAQPLVRESYRDPAGTFATNVMGTVNLLEAVRLCDHPPRAVVIVTTDKCYENREWVWGYRENEPMGGHDPYSASKGCAELATAAYRRSFFQNTQTAVATARAGNVIGGGDWAADRLIPDAIKSFVDRRPVSIRNPTSVRPWQLVLEPLAGYLTLAERLVDSGQGFAEAWNFGPRETDARPVEWIVNRMVRRWGDGAGFDIAPGPHPHEANFLKLDTTKAAAELNWKSRTDLDAALDWTVDWYTAWKTGADVRAVCDDQIGRFLELPGH